MLSEQLDPTRFEWELAAAAGVPGASARVSRRRRVPGESRKLEDVLKELDARQLVGDLGDDLPYVRGRLEISWGRFGGHWSSGDLVFFVGVSEGLLVGLGGSTRHVVGSDPRALPEGTSVFTPNSYTPYIMEMLSREFPVGMAAAGLYPSQTKDEAVRHAMASVMAAYAARKGPIEHVEFVAKRLLAWDNDHTSDYIGETNGDQLFTAVDRVLLGTPLYVALAE